MGLPESSALDLELENGWLTIWFNEPAARNPLTAARVEGLVALCAALKGRRDVRGVTVRGRGGVFCAGGDLKAFGAMANATREEAIRLSLSGAAAFEAIEALEQVTVMAVEGFAMAGGCGLACCGDVVIAEAGARFALTETRIGLVPAQIAPFVIGRLGAREARKLMLTGAVIDAWAAERAGLADEVTADMDAAVAGVRDAVLKCGPAAVAATKALIRALPCGSREAGRRRAAEVFADALLGEEGREGVAAFARKRRPNWAPE